MGWAEWGGGGGQGIKKITEPEMKCPHRDRSSGSRTASHAGCAYGQGDVENGDGGEGGEGRGGGQLSLFFRGSVSSGLP